MPESNEADAEAEAGPSQDAEKEDEGALEDKHGKYLRKRNESAREMRRRYGTMGQSYMDELVRYEEEHRVALASTDDADVERVKLNHAVFVKLMKRVFKQKIKQKLDNLLPSDDDEEYDRAFARLAKLEPLYRDRQD